VPFLRFSAERQRGKRKGTKNDEEDIEPGEKFIVRKRSLREKTT
jgi:hypothetical protein